MKVKYLIYGVIFAMTVTLLWAQEKQAPSQAPPPPAASQPGPTAQAPAKAPPSAAGTQPAAEAPAAPGVPHTFVITPEEAALKNPLRLSEISVERGKTIYQTQCAMCHGEKGDGKGEIVADMKINPPDFTKPGFLDQRSDGELFTIIKVGDATMPGQGSRMSDTVKWELVNYLRALSGKVPLKSTEEELQQGTVVVQDNSKPPEEKPKAKPKRKSKEDRTD